ncbi:MAG: MFS transporter [Chloroflexi bacterium]|nr:MAG: MFS transporter [Chloroflexota bacterium]MBL1194491.1 MFS transporter [Chloroflexota bacterium]NOH11779.1 BCD family MFS transporter [Chloroflexota bacterium]
MKTTLRIINVLRLALFPIGYGLTGALIGGTLNRIMIAELGFAATMVGIFFAIPLLVSPIRVWLGYRSDGFPIFGKRREPYIILGALVTGLGAIMAVALMVHGQPSSGSLILGLLVAFVLFGFGRNLGHNTFQALLTEKFDEKARQRAITLYEVATLLGLVAGAGGLGSALENFEPARLLMVTIAVATIVLLLSIFAALANEPRKEDLNATAEKARKLPFTQVMREVVVGDRQVRLFFVLVLFTFIGTLAQDVLLEPYGALTLNMSVGDTTRLTAFWGVGVMISMLLSGIILLRWLGYMTLMRTGMITSILVFIGVIASGASGNAAMFNNLVLAMGLGTGLAGAGMLAGVVSFTTEIRAGLLMGVWGFANLLGRALGSVMGGAVVDIMQSVTNGNAFISYSVVFAIEILMLLIALYLTTRLNVRESRAQVEAQGEIQLAAEGATG